AGTRQHHVGLSIASIGAGPFPDADSPGAVGDGLVDGQPLRLRLFSGDDDVDVVLATQAMIVGGQQRVRIGRQVDADNVGSFVGDVVNEPGVLVGEPVVVLSPYVRRQQVIE